MPTIVPSAVRVAVYVRASTGEAQTAAQIVEVRIQQVADLTGACIGDQEADVEIGGRGRQPLSSVRVCKIDGDDAVSDTVAG